jgi:hypothetical protein
LTISPKIVSKPLRSVYAIVIPFYNVIIRCVSALLRASWEFGGIGQNFVVCNTKNS